MANIYESDAYNIESITRSNTEIIFDEEANANINFNYYSAVLQRLPLSSYPLTTEITFTSREVSPDLEKSEWIAQALPVINADLAAFDAEFTGELPEAANVTIDFSPIFD